MKLFDGKAGGSFEGGLFPFARGKLAKGSKKFFLVALGLFLQGIEAVAGFFLRAELLEFDAVVIPVEFLAEIPDAADKIALAGLAQGEALAALKNHFDHAAGFRGLHPGERILGCGVRTIAGKEEIQERFINLHPVFEKRDFELFAMQAAAHGFERFLCGEEGSESGGAIVASLRELPLEQMSLVSQDRRLQMCQSR